ncbi:MAG: serine acetyltransferase [Clostridia bacterium]|nr:serine acetyltransferase [Clostridia bacterium]
MKDVTSVTNQMLLSYGNNVTAGVEKGLTLPDRAEVISTLNDVRKLFFPAFFAAEEARGDLAHFAESTLTSIYYRIRKQLERAYQFVGEPIEKAESTASSFVSSLPKVRDLLFTDLEATFEGDPAAKSKEEIVFSYPGFYAIMVYRVAHVLYEMGVPFIPRMMTEHAHGKTGIDVNPGAKIGEYFFIDHGTGIVIGETTVIGNRVKIYQNVTLGALSPRKGQSLAGKKRHPTVEDDVTIYSGASILGGETVIGKGAVIGGNCFLTESVSAGVRVSAKPPELIIIQRGKKS